jgi:hypothetical protein
MAVLRMPNQREIVEVQYYFPDGQLLTHMVIVISHKDLNETEDTFYGVVLSTKKRPEEYAMQLTPAMLSKPLGATSYIKTHLIQNFYREDITKHNISVVKSEAFEKIKQRIVASIFSPVA